MSSCPEDKKEIVERICYTELVYERVNKKLNISISKNEIEVFILETLQKTEIENFKMIGKNYYVTNTEDNIRITINSNTFRLITVDKISK